MIDRSLALAALLTLSACDPPWAFEANGIPPPAKCRSGPGLNRHVVLTFYRRALIDKDVRGAFETFMTPGFIEHKPDVTGGTREATIVFLEGLMKELPSARWEIVRSVADEHLVAVHARFQPAPGAPEYAIADFFRVENCRIVEHWDVVAAPTDKSQNPNPRT
ncbi:MAG: nuclear transport factor 2 family protein [Sphingomicrobium sp.]